MKKRKLKLGKIRIDGDTQPRAGINTTLVAEYATAMESGNADFPPAVAARPRQVRGVCERGVGGRAAGLASRAWDWSPL